MSGLLTFRDMQKVSLDRVYEEFPIPSPHPSHIPGPVVVRLRNMWAGEYFDLMESTLGKEAEQVWRADHFGELMAAFCWVDDEGNRCLTDDDLKSEEWSHTSPAFQTALLGAVRKVCGEIEQPGTKPLDSTVKNSETASGSDYATEQPPALDSGE